MSRVTLNNRPEPDALLSAIADYVSHGPNPSEEAWRTARFCLMDAVGCAILALRYPECVKLLGPIVPGTVVPDGCRVPGTRFELDPVQGAFNIGTLIRWLDFNDTWLAAEWGHPSDNLGALLAVTDYRSRQNIRLQKQPLLVRDLLAAMVKAYEIQGVLALENAFNRVGLDHVLLVRIASTALATQLLGGGKDHVINAVSNAWVDGGALRTYRHAPNTGSRKSWAAGDATARGVRHAWMALQGEMGYPSAITASTWGFSEALFRAQQVKLSRPFGSYVMENVLFKISFPAEFHAQTAVEAAIALHAQTGSRIQAIERVVIQTQEPALRIINKTGPLHNPADRDHCLQYMVAVPLIFGRLTADDYEESVAQNERIDALRALMVVEENKQYTVDYLDPSKRSITNAVQVFFSDGTASERVEIEYPLGHRRRRVEGMPLLLDKFRSNLTTAFNPGRVAKIVDLWSDPEQLDQLPVNEFMELFLPE